MDGGIRVTAAYEPKLPRANLELYVGGHPTVTFQAPGSFFKEANFKLYAGASFESRRFSRGPYERVFVNWRDLETEADQEVFYRAWTEGGWEPASQLTTGSLTNQTVRAVVSNDGRIALVWRQGAGLVMDLDLAGQPDPVRDDAQTPGWADFELTFGPEGNLALLWQEMGPEGPDGFYSVYHPVSGTWSLEAGWFGDGTLARSFAPVWDDAGNLTLAYNRVELVYANKSVTVEGGEVIEIPDVPQRGRVDLAVTKRALITDLELRADGFTVLGENFLPGDPLRLQAEVFNAGDVAVRDVVVGFMMAIRRKGGCG